MNHERIVNINGHIRSKTYLRFPNYYSLPVLTVHLHFKHLFSENQWILIQICFSLFCIILETCFIIKDSDPTSFIHHLITPKNWLFRIFGCYLMIISDQDSYSCWVSRWHAEVDEGVTPKVVECADYAVNEKNLLCCVCGVLQPMKSFYVSSFMLKF